MVSIRREAVFDVKINGANINSVLAPILTSISVDDSAGTHGDTATIVMSDIGGRIALPKAGAKVQVALGWVGVGMREVFSGAVDEVRSSGSRGSGMVLTISAKGFDALGKAKEPQERHFDDKAVKDIITATAKDSGVTVEVDPQIADLVIPYIDMRGESLLHFGQRLARMVGASFRVQGERAVVARRASDYTPSITAAWGDNLHSWDITPVVGRATFRKVKARYYDKATGRLEEVEAEVNPDSLSDAEWVRRELAADRDEAERAVKADSAAIQERSGVGSVTIEGAPDAVPDGLCVLAGTRPGIDGSYRIKRVSHNYSRGSGYTTTLELAQPQGGAGADTR